MTFFRHSPKHLDDFFLVNHTKIIFCFLYIAAKWVDYGLFGLILMTF